MKLTQGTLLALCGFALTLGGCEAEDRGFDGRGDDAAAETEESGDGGSTEVSDTDGGTDESTDDNMGGASDEAADAATDETIEEDASSGETEEGDAPDGGVEPEDDSDSGELPVADCEDDADCNDGNVCNGEEICEEGECLSGQNADDGQECEIDGVDELLLCIEGNCTQTLCGDGIVDERTDEECDDGNDQDGDGCEVGCTLSCSDDSHCDDGNVCNGEETCDTDRGVCLAGEAPDEGTECDSDRACFDARCIGLGCGNGALEEGEDCDDGNSEDGDGCDADCTLTCVEDAECDDGNVCNGTETCDTENNVCLAGDDLACEDGNDCTENLCDPETGCSFPLIDVDGDGHASADLGSCGDDCDDEDGAVYEGAAELCDEKDNNCDGDVDEEAPVWYVDCDGDDFALSSAASVQQCEMPAEAPTGCTEGSAATWTSRAPDREQADCYDVASAVRPRLTSDENNSAWSATEYAGRPSGSRYDHNCDDEEEQRYTATGLNPDSGCGLIVLPPIEVIGAAAFVIAPVEEPCLGSTGWTGNSAPACGGEAEYTYCASRFGGECTRYTRTQTQTCR